MNEPAWVEEARRHIGVREIPGPRHEPKIIAWWKAIRRGGIKTDEVPWCAAFVGGCLEAVGIVSSRYESARSYLTWGIKLQYPAPGCVAVLERHGGGHVGFVVAGDGMGRIMLLGGNQHDQVSISPFDESRVISYRWPRAVPITDHELPILGSTIPSSTNEA